jgi:hypothetical protein
MSYVNLLVEKTNFVLVFTMKFILCDKINFIS